MEETDPAIQADVENYLAIGGKAFGNYAILGANGMLSSYLLLLHWLGMPVSTTVSKKGLVVWVNVKRLRQSSLEALFQLHPTITSKPH